MRTTLQPLGNQEAAHRGPPRALPDGATRPPLQPDDASPAPLTPAAITLLHTYGRVKGYPKKTVLLYAGTPSPACYVVLNGCVRVYVSTASGKELTLRLPERGEPFGDLGLLEDAPSVGMAVTLTPTTLLVVPRTSFGACLAAHPALALEFLRLGAQRIDHLSRLAQSLAFADVPSRIMALLATRAQDQEDHGVVERRLTHQEIADRIGATRETVCRVMKELYGRGGLARAHGRLPVGAHTGHSPRTRPSIGASS
jgi:CRP/FNR family transcriptional regulator, cyclic AMP receptor protein